MESLEPNSGEIFDAHVLYLDKDGFLRRTLVKLRFDKFFKKAYLPDSRQIAYEIRKMIFRNEQEANPPMHHEDHISGSLIWTTWKGHSLIVSESDFPIYVRDKGPIRSITFKKAGA